MVSSITQTKISKRMKETLQKTRWLLAVGFCLAMLSNEALAQNRTVSGTVKDKSTGDPVPGVSVLVKNTSTGTITDGDGKYNIEVSSDQDILVFSFVGYAKQEVAVAGQTSMDIDLETDLTTLDEVVVVGYGEQKKSVVTGAISSVKAEELSSQPLTRIEQALQGRASGVTIAANSGQPGSSAKVLIRGITSLNNSDPLWVIDGVAVDNGGIGYLNQSDIESIEVLKDAASAAIYGTRAASGVILITTKKGKAGDFQVNYNGFYGVSSPARKLDLLNATQYATLRNEMAAAANLPAPFEDPTAFGKGTDWQGAIFNSGAKRQSHDLSISGGNDKSTFYTSIGYLDQEGIVAKEISNYSRVNLRFNSTHKVKSWLTFGQTLGYSHTKSVGLGNTNSEFGGPLSSAINLDPITPLIETDPDVYDDAPYTSTGAVKDANGNYYGLSSIVGQELTNPLAYIKTRLGNNSKADDFVGNLFAEVEALKGLKFRTTLGGKFAVWGSESFTPIYYLNPSTSTSQTSFYRSTNQVFNYNIENTLTYTKSIDVHNFTVLVGQGAYLDGRTRGTNVTYYDLPVDNFDDASTNYDIPASDRIGDGLEGPAHKLSSLFARVNYNYNEKYLLTAIARRDGSSRFGANKHYGFFPSVSVGWVASAEDFWIQNRYVDFLKIRAGYGVVGNDNIDDFMFLSTIGGGRNYTMGDTNDFATGYSPNAPSNPNLHWEETSQIDIGFEANLLNNISVNFDWYKKQTTGILMQQRIPGYIGAISDPWANVGGMENTGIELELGYKTRIGDVEIGLNANASHFKNKVTDLGDKDFLDGGQTFQASSYPITRVEVGQSFNSFYGFEMLGIFQTQEDVLSHTSSEGTLIQPDARPGDVIWADLDDDGDIDADDRTYLGSPFPKWSYGFTLSAAWKGIDLVVFAQGITGNTIFQGLRRLDVAYGNWQTEALGRWTGPGSSNSFPRLNENDANNNFTNPSKLYLEDGDYFRIKTLQIGYTLPKALVSKIGLQKTRFYVMGENLFTFTKYTGYDPEIGGFVMGIDRGIYPQAKSFMVGINLGF
jgi:TonB-dependent starch-binding outer membrane protein SusC